MAPVNTIRNKEGIDDESLILKFVKNFQNSTFFVNKDAENK